MDNLTVHYSRAPCPTIYGMFDVSLVSFCEKQILLLLYLSGGYYGLSMSTPPSPPQCVEIFSLPL